MKAVIDVFFPAVTLKTNAKPSNSLIDTEKCNGNLPNSLKSEVYSVAIVKARVEDGA